ncbi:hypothetical protein C8Q74DRAFT_299787 [Fomes fomentarius]|nr:hypothetical protein C8Q74DRAFT_299787 [Fomes fomentarius]
MDSLAVELLREIYTLACADGGFTGCSLSLVSKHVRETSRSARFHSISLTSGTAQQLSNFLLCFHQECAWVQRDEGYTPAIRHLCISIANCKDTKGDWHGGPYSIDEPRITHERQEYIAQLIAFVQFVAPNLVTLSLIRQSFPRLDDIPCSGFPMLDELSVTAPDLFVLGENPPHPLYPRLRRLHLANSPHYGLLSWVDGKRAPNLTHLRISELGDVDATVKTVICESSSVDILTICKLMMPSLDAIAAPTTYPQLQKVLIRPCPPPPDGNCGCAHPYMEHEEFLADIEDLRARWTIPIDAIPYKESSTIQKEGGHTAAIKREWLDRLHGGQGCWTSRSG